MFRNTLILVIVLLAALIAVLAGWHALNTDFLPLCSSKGEPRCLTGPESNGLDVALVALVGALGGFLALVFGLAKTDTAPSRYDPKTWLAFLRPVTGAATALVGVLLLQAGILVEPVTNTSEVILVYAVLFGFSQQLLTQFVDKRAEALISPSG